MPLQRLRVKQFQCHRKLEVVLDEQITVLVGSSDVGKSAVLRALGWVCTNKPLGDAHITHGETSCWVELTVDGVKAVRIKKKDKNEYRLGDKIFAAFGQEVPQEIQDFLKIDPVLNLQKQHDPPFLLGMTAGEAARELNRVIDLGEIDSALSRAQGEVKRAQAELELVEEREAGWRGIVDSSNWLDGLTTRLALWTEKAGQLATTGTASRRLGELLEQIQDCEDSSKRGTAFCVAVEGLVKVWSILSGSRQKLQSLTALLDELERLEGARPLPPLTELKATYERLLRTRDELESLGEILEEVESSRAASRDAESRLAEARSMLAGVTACPLCEQPLTQTK